MVTNHPEHDPDSALRLAFPSLADQLADLEHPARSPAPSFLRLHAQVLRREPFVIETRHEAALLTFRLPRRACTRPFTRARCTSTPRHASCSSTSTCTSTRSWSLRVSPSSARATTSCVLLWPMHYKARDAEHVPRSSSPRPRRTTGALRRSSSSASRSSGPGTRSS